MSAIPAPGFTRRDSTYPVPGRSHSMKMADRTQQGVYVLHASKYGVQGGYVAAVLEDGLKTAQLLTAIAYYLLGIAQFIRGALALYWSVKRSQFYHKVRQGLDQCDHPDAKAAYVWGVFQAHMSLDDQAIKTKLLKFKSEYDAKGIAAKQAALIKDYEGELNSWFDYFSDVSYRIESWVFGLFGKKLRGENLVQKRHSQVRQELQFVSRQIKSMSARGATTKEIDAAIDGFKKARIEASAHRANLKALGCLTSSTLVQELYHHRNSVDISLESHKAIILGAYLKAEGNYHATKVANIVEGIAQIFIGLVSVVLVGTVKAAWVKIFLGALGSLIYARTVIEGADTVRYLMGVETRKTFAQKVHQLFSTFDKERIEQRDFDDEIYGDY